ncbi:MAG: type II toxin-antitoxin system VapC family toxin [Balneolaceae bacterium]
MIVVDTNILVGLWLPSDSSEVCEQLYQKDSEWLAPILWQSEFRNVLALYLRKEMLNLTDALMIMEEVEQQMKQNQFYVNSLQVLQCVNQSICSAYDCEFVSLAKDLNLKLFTMDKQLLKEFPEIARHPLSIAES